MSYTLHPEAEAELMETAVYLAEHVSRRVANAYLDEFERVASLIDLYPKLGTPEDEEYRTYPLSKYKTSLLIGKLPQQAAIKPNATQFS